MKPNLQTQSNILTVFLDADTAHVTLPLVLAQLKTDLNDEKFYFNYQLLVENSLISDEYLNSGELAKAGITHSFSGPSIIGNQKLRLTQSGHDFATALSNKEVLNRLKSEFKDAPFKVIFDGSQKLLTHFFKKKIDDLTRE